MKTQEPKNGSFFISLSYNDYQRCKEHAERIADKLNPHENYGVTKRDRDLIISRTTAGKLCEMAVSKFLKENYEIEMEHTFDSDESIKVDADLVSPINKRIIEIKSSKSTAKWLLVPWDDIQNKQRHFVEPDVYMMCRINWEDKDPTVEICGYAGKKQMRAHYKNTYDFRRNDDIPGTKEKFHNNNIGRHIDHLSKDWDLLAEHLTEKIDE